VAEALIARAEAVEAQDDFGEEPREGATVDALELLDALHVTLGEPRDAILRWPWKWFCAEWARLYPAAAKERARLERQREQEAFRALDAQWGTRG
jgi:hypothetical protein